MSSLVIGLGYGAAGINTNLNNHIAYAWAEIDGFSKFNSYVGNGSTDGTFVYTGFRPKFILIKGTSAGTNWAMFNSIVNTSNPVINELLANTSAIENTTGTDLDFLSNGFKLRSANADINTSAQTYIYAAFGEFPLKYANAALTERVRFNDTDVQSFFSRVTAAGGNLSLTEQSAINTLVTSLKSNGTWAKMKLIYPIVGGSASSCSQNLISSSYTASFNGGLTIDSSGITGNGTNGYINTNFIHNNLISKNNGTSIYVSIEPTSLSYVCGVYQNSPPYPVDYISWVTNISKTVAKQTIDYPTPSGRISFTNSLVGLITATTSSNTDRQVYKNGINIASNTFNDTASLTALNYFVLALNQNGGAANYTNGKISFFALHDNLTSTEALNYYNAIQQFQITLNRQVV